MGVIAYYLDNKKWENQLSLIGLRHLYSSYLGEHMASVLIKLTKKYEISDRLGKFYNIVIFIIRIPQRRELFIKILNFLKEDVGLLRFNKDTKNLYLI